MMRHAISHAARALRRGAASVLRRDAGRAPRRGATAAALASVALAAGAHVPAQAQQVAALTPARYAALDAVYVASLPLDGNPTAAERLQLRRVCGGLDRNDRLLAVTRTTCLTSLQALAPARAFARCSTPSACRRSARSMRIVLSRTLANARASNRVVALELAPGACRTELRASRALLRSLTALRDGLLLLERGLRMRDRTLTRRAERRVFEAGEALQDQPTAAQSLEIFRGVCAPAAPQGA